MKEQSKFNVLLLELDVSDLLENGGSVMRRGPLDEGLVEPMRGASGSGRRGWHRSPRRDYEPCLMKRCPARSSRSTWALMEEGRWQWEASPVVCLEAWRSSC